MAGYLNTALLRPRRLRHPGRRPGVLPQGRQGPQRRASAPSSPRCSRARTYYDPAGAASARRPRAEKNIARARTAGTGSSTARSRTDRMSEARAGQVHEVPDARRSRRSRPSSAARSATWSTSPTNYITTNSDITGPEARAGRLRDPHHLRQEEGRAELEAAVKKVSKANIDAEEAPADRQVRPVRRGLGEAEGRRDRGHLRRRGRHQALHQQRRLHRCAGRLDLQAVRPGGSDAGRQCATRRARRTRTRTARTPVSPQERLQRQEQAQDLRTTTAPSGRTRTARSGSSATTATSHKRHGSTCARR